MDLSKVVINNTAPCEIYLPDGSKSDIIIEMYGIDSKERQVAFKNSMDKLPKGSQPTAEDLELRGLDLLAGCIASWKNIMEGKKKVECNETNKLAILTQHKWLREQVDKFCADRANFLHKA